MYWLDQVHTKELPFGIPQFNLFAAPELDLGTMHGFDMLYIFGFMNAKEAPMAFPEDVKTEGDSKIGKSMIQAWTSFAKTGYVSY